MATQLKDENEIKIFILYLLDKIGYPLDYPSIGSIMMQDGIVNFFDFAQCFFSLVDAGHIREIISDRRAAKILFFIVCFVLSVFSVLLTEFK